MEFRRVLFRSAISNFIARLLDRSGLNLVVCDMRLRGEGQAPVPVPAMEAELFVRAAGARTGHLFEPQRTDPFPIACLAAATDDVSIGPCVADLQVMLGIRSQERRVGAECDSTCRSLC